MRLEPRDRAPSPARHRLSGGWPSARHARLRRIARRSSAARRRSRFSASSLKGAAGSRFALIETLTRATPLIFTGLAAAVAFRAKLWNIGAEAQLYIGAVATVVLGTGLLPLPAPLLVPILMIAAVARRRRCCCSAPPFSKMRFGVDEVVTTLLLNFIVLLFVSHAARRAAEGPDGPRLAAVAEGRSPTRSSPKLVQGKRLHLGFVIAVVAAAGRMGHQHAHRARLRDARRRLQPARRRASPACRSTA